MLTFYFAPGSSSMAVHIALYEIGVPFDARSLSFAKKEQLQPAFLAINPEGKVPTLILGDGKPLSEVAACLYYLAKTHPEANLLPNDIEGEAQAISWMSFVAATLHSARRQGPEHTLKVFAIADQKLGTKEWAMDRYSIADIHLFRLYWRFHNAPRPPHDRFTHLEAHYERMMARPAVQRTLEIESAIGYELPW